MMAPLVAFVHMPRSGGTTLTEVMRSVYGPRLLVANPHIGDPRTFPDELIEHVSEKRDFYAAFSGHFAYGIHSVFSRPTKYVSCVRDPVERFESYFSYVRQQKAHHHHEAARNKRIGEFFRYLQGAGDIELFNLQCLLLCGRTDFRSAREWIKAHYLAVAPLPMIAPTVAYIARYLGWAAVNVPNMNSAERGDLASDMVESDLRALEQGNSADHDIVNFCADFMTKQLARQDLLLQDSPAPGGSLSAPRKPQAAVSAELRDRLSRLEERIFVLTTDRLEQARQVSELQQRMEELNIDREARLQVILDQQAQMTSLGEQIGAQQACIDQVNADREARLRVILEQQEQMTGLGEQIGAQQACINQVNADREARLNVILDQQGQLDLLRRQIAEANAYLEARQQTVLEQQTQLDALRAQVDEAKEHLSTQANRIITQNAGQVERENLIAEQRDMMRNLETSHRLSTQRLQAELAETKRQFDECDGNVQQLKIEMTMFLRSRWVRLGSALRLTKLRTLATRW